MSDNKFERVGTLTMLGTTTLGLCMKEERFDVSVEKITKVLNEEEPFAVISKTKREEDGWPESAGYIAISRSGKGMLIKVNDKYYFAARSSLLRMINTGRGEVVVSGFKESSG